MPTFEVLLYVLGLLASTVSLEIRVDRKLGRKRRRRR